MAPLFQAAAEHMEPHIRLLKVDVDALPGIAGRFAIRSIPTLVAFRQGIEVGRQSGVPPPGALREWLSRWAQP
jgi:thioredoxin 2